MAARRRLQHAALFALRHGGATLLVHASFAFVHAVEHGAALEPPLRSCVDAILEWKRGVGLGWCALILYGKWIVRIRLWVGVLVGGEANITSQ